MAKVKKGDLVSLNIILSLPPRHDSATCFYPLFAWTKNPFDGDGSVAVFVCMCAKKCVGL